MFNVNGTNIELSRGDTGAVPMRVPATRRDTGEPYTFGERDRAVFSIKSANGNIVKQKSYQMKDNTFTVIFMNGDTDILTPGGYQWDVRCVIIPYYTDEIPYGPWPEYDELTYPVAVGDKVRHGGTYYTAIAQIASEEEWNPEHWQCADGRIPVDGDQVITPKLPMSVNLLTVVGDI